MPAAQPRWKAKRFGEGADLYLRRQWMGDVGPVILGECRYTARDGKGSVVGVAATQEEAKRCVENTARTSPELVSAIRFLLSQ